MTPEAAEAHALSMMATAMNLAPTASSLAPVFLIVPHAKDAQPLVMMIPFTDQASKEQAFGVASLLCVENDSELMAFICEAWVADGPLAEGVSPSESDTRNEVVMLTTSYFDESGSVRHFQIMRPIERREDGRIAGLGPETRLTSGFGRMLSIFPTSRPSRMYRETAAAALAAMGVSKRAP